MIPARTPSKVVALLIETSNEYARGLLRGVMAYMREHQLWTTYLAEHGRGDEPPEWLAHWRGDGILVRVENRRIAQAVQTCGVPVVDVSAANLIPSVPWVETNDAAIARVAFEHLYERGLRRFAFYGDARFNWSKWRCDEFRRLCAAANCPCAVLDVPADAGVAAGQPHGPERPSTEMRHKPPGDGSPHRITTGTEWSNQMSRTAEWVRSLEKPIGAMACFDPLGRQLLQACRVANVAVPDEVAVVGVDDDDLLCELADPPLSSVAPNAHQTGYEAAALLDRIMRGAAVEPRGYLVEPLGIAVRKSSDMLAIEDEDVSTALRFIREHACEGINVGDVLARLPVSRRALEARFKKLVGRSPHDEIERVRLNYVREMLRQTDLPLVTIAQKAGFNHEEYLSVVFKKRFGIPPGVYRRRQSQR